jgi:phosphocarrier protein FPr/phosphocarrier protein
MMGPGVAIDPTDGIVRSPADATIVSIPESAHAVTLRLENGAELLIHVGLETVALKGVGFRAISSAGAQVKAGDPLIEVDLAAVANGARSLVTPIVLANEGFELELGTASRPVEAGERIGAIRGRGASASNSDGKTYERAVRIGAPHGLHARPAARIAALVKQQGAEVTAILGEKSVNARSTVALMSLGVKQGDDLRLAGRGERARTAIDAVVGLIEAGLGEPATAVVAPRKLGGPICASPGLAIGTIFQLRTADLPVPRDSADEASEHTNLAQAIQSVADELNESSAGDLAAAHRELLADPELRRDAEREIADGRSAAFAWRSACGTAREALVATGNDLLAERAADLLDIERQILRALVGGEGAVPDLPSEAIVLASDLLPSEFLALDKAKLSGICTAEGGPTSHVAILAAAAGVPMIVAAGPEILSLADGGTAVLDAGRCRLEASPSDERLKEAREQVQERSARRAAEVGQAQEQCFTADGVRIEVFANLASVVDADPAVEAGAEGCGLLRTEFLAIGRTSAPDEEEQRQAYAAIAAALGDRPLIVRTFDIGADKKVYYLGTAAEENPALGLRGVRLSLARPDLLATQMRAIVRGVPAAQRRIMLPMISDLEEFRAARAFLREAEAAVGSQGETPLGIMIETPASALLAHELAAEAAFLSVGTNDLAQYALAADRTNSGVSAMLDGLHPAVLRLIRLAAEGASAHNRWLGVCGGLASDPAAVPILLGLGVTELSAAPAAVPAIKAIVRTQRLDDCRKLAERACAAASAAEVRAIASEAIA